MNERVAETLAIQTTTKVTTSFVSNSIVSTSSSTKTGCSVDLPSLCNYHIYVDHLTPFLTLQSCQSTNYFASLK